MGSPGAPQEKILLPPLLQVSGDSEGETLILGGGTRPLETKMGEPRIVLDYPNIIRKKRLPSGHSRAKCPSWPHLISKYELLVVLQYYSKSFTCGKLDLPLFIIDDKNIYGF